MALSPYVHKNLSSVVSNRFISRLQRLCFRVVVLGSAVRVWVSKLCAACCGVFCVCGRHLRTRELKLEVLKQPASKVANQTVSKAAQFCASDKFV